MSDGIRDTRGYGNKEARPCPVCGQARDAESKYLAQVQFTQDRMQERDTAQRLLRESKLRSGALEALATELLRELCGLNRPMISIRELKHRAGLLGVEV